MLLAWLVIYLLQSGKTADYLNTPKRNDVYIFQEENKYAPMRIDSLTKTQVYMRSYTYYFEDAVPSDDQILANEFDTLLFAIYERAELKRLYNANQLVKIYRNPYKKTLPR